MSPTCIVKSALVSVILLLVHGSCVADDFEWETGNTTSNWNSAANWAGTLGEFPDDNTDSALIGPTNLNPKLNAGNVTVGSLFMFGGAELSTGNYALTVQSSNFQSGTTSIVGPLTRLTVAPSPVANDFDTDFLFISDGTLFLDQGAKAQIDDTLSMDEDASIAGNGILELNGGENFQNNGELRAAGGTLTIQRTGTERIDLDGAGAGALIAGLDSRLIIDMPNTGPAFNGVMSIARGGEIRINDNWRLLSEIDFNGGSGTARQSGNRTTYEGLVNINSGTAILAADLTTITGTAQVNLAPHATLQFDSPTTIDRPESLSVGYQSTFVVNDVVTIGQGNGNFDWDGQPLTTVADGRTVVNPGGELYIDVDRIDAATPNRYDGHLEINSGFVQVSTSQGQWEMAGLMNLNNTNGDITFLLGADQMLVTGDVVVGGNGSSVIRATTIFSASSHIDVRSDAVLRLDVRPTPSDPGRSAIINGGSWTGAGTVNLDGSTRVTAATTVDMPNGAFEITAGGIAEPGSVTLDDVLTINASRVGWAPDNLVFANMTINGAAGRLDVRLTDPSASYEFTSGRLVLNGPTGGLTGLHLTGSDMVFEALMTVNGDSTSQARIVFDQGSFIDLSTDATLNLASGTQASPNVIRPGSVFRGDGTLVVPTGGHLALESGGTALVDLLVEGTLQVGTTTHGVGTVGYLMLEPMGVLQINIDGTTPGTEYDRLVSIGAVELGGTLEVLVNELGGSYADPTVAGTFDEFLFFEGSSSFANFDGLIYDGEALTPLNSLPNRRLYHVGEGLFRILEDTVFDYRLTNYRALPGDANGDGVVDGTDFLIWNDHKFTSGTDWLTGDFNGDGVTDGADFLLWNDYKFTSVNFGGTLVPEPTTATCWVGLIGLLWHSRTIRRRK